ncbi:MAG: precorrin-6A synthase (deacetylating) [Corynebacterium sp.]|uniref:precorrin-6A synthase (deacetylating) n=1 Tax=Corynebacterium sp. TaxID=1720 RepID=UPI0026DB9623|nr:precorrin-6A synthase (deacetylating) [Corynebacterium sp.]MDO5097332.1 precorrin-6A synthase (deacetylating) [Corynebacterium sp.]
MREIVVIGIGAGNPQHITLEGISALRRSDVVVALDKGDIKDDLLGVRREILNAHNPDIPLIAVADPPRDRNPQDYSAEVHRWHDARAELLERTIIDNTHPDGVAAFLVWGDPSLYDSTLRIIERFTEPMTVTVIPGITAVQALTAAHKILLNRVGEEIVITTGRQVSEGARHRNCVVMLDGGAAWLEAANPHTYMWWGAYVGTPHEVLVHGYVSEIGAELAERKKKLRAEHGWIMDIYLLRELDSSS